MSEFADGEKAKSEREQRLESAIAVIGRYSSRHVKIDVGIGLAGIFPGMGKVALLGAIALQAPVIYQPMVREIGALYSRRNDASMQRMTTNSALGGAVADVASEFGLEFIKSSAREIIMEQGIGLGLAWIPVVGGVIAAGLDAVIARKMTRLVGAMALIYHENSNAWIESRKKTRSVVLAALKTSPSASVPEIVLAILKEHGLEIEPVPQHKVEPSTEGEGVYAATLADGAVEGVAVGATTDGINAFVLDAIDRFRRIDPHTIEEIHRGLSTNAGVYAEAGLLGNVKGYTGEEITSADLHTPLPDDPTIKGWDIPYDGQQWQIKVGSTAYQRATEALGDNPKYPIISDPDTAARLQADGHEAMGLGNLDNEHLTSMTEQTTVSIDDLFHLAPEVPVVSAMLIGYTQIRRHIAGEISMTEAIANVTIHVGSRSAAIFILTTTAVGVAAAAGTLPFAGPFVAGAAITGSLAGREIAERLLAIRLPKSVASNLTDILRRSQQQIQPAPGIA